jgi:hypothetical protein
VLTGDGQVEEQSIVEAWFDGGTDTEEPAVICTVLAVLYTNGLGQRFGGAARFAGARSERTRVEAHIGGRSIGLR